MIWEFCPGRYQPPSAGYVRPDGQARGFCRVCGVDRMLKADLTVRHHFRLKASATQTVHR